MKTPVGWIIALILAVVPLSFAQKPAAKAATRKHAAVQPLTKEHLQQVMDAWSTMDTSKVAPYYSQADDNPYFDVEPLQYPNWAEYAKQMDKTFAEFQSFKVRLNDDVHIHNLGNWAWSTTTWHADTVTKDGKAEPLDARWTAIWENRGGKWIIAHDHNSVPLPPPTPAAQSSEAPSATPEAQPPPEADPVAATPPQQQLRFFISPNVM